MVFNIPVADSLNLTRDYHALRPNLNPKWLIGWPLSLKQRKFIECFFGSLCLHSNFNDSKIKDISTKTEFFRYMIILNLYLHQHTSVLEVLLNSGLKTIKGEGILSCMLQELRFYVLYSKAKKIFDFG
jgi:hypothetical protein